MTSLPPIPSSLKWVKGLAIFQFILALLGLTFFLWLFSTSGDSDFILGMQEGAAKGLGQDVYYLSSPEGLGFLTGTFVFALLAPLFMLLGIHKRSKGWTIASLLIYGGTFVSNPSPLALAICILVLQKSSREYTHLSSEKS